MISHGAPTSVLQNPLWEALLQNISKVLPDCVVLYARRQCSSEHNIVFVLLGAKWTIPVLISVWTQELQLSVLVIQVMSWQLIKEAVEVSSVTYCTKIHCTYCPAAW